MSNMSYCRFHNTSLDLNDCALAVEDIINGEEEGIERDELHAAKQLFRTAAEMLQTIADASGVSVEELLDDERKIDEAVEFNLKKGK